MLGKVVCFFSVFCISSLSLAGPAYKSFVNTGISKALGLNATLNSNGPNPSTNECLGCHGQSGPPMNNYGRDLAQAALSRGYADGAGSSWNVANAANGLFCEIIFDTLGLDSDNDSFTNHQELASGTNPGDSSSVPSADPNVSPITSNPCGAAVGGDSTGSTGDREILTRSQNESSPTSTLSGCGSKQVTQLTQQDEFVTEAQSQGVWLALLLLVLPMILLTFIRQKKPVPIPVKRRDQQR